MPARYTVETTTDVDLTAATAKTILSVICAANAPIRLIEFSVSFDGTSASAEPCTVELCSSTQAGAGTSTSQSPVQTGGPTRTVQASGARNYTAEPTTLTVLKRWLVHPTAGMIYQAPLGREVEQNTTSDALCLRVTSPSGTENVQGYIEFEEG